MSDEFENSQPPPPMFVNQLEHDFAKQITDEVMEQVIGQAVIYYPIDLDNTNYHPVYGEAIEKVFLPPIRVFCKVTLEGIVSMAADSFNVDAKRSIMVHFHTRRLREDQNLEVRVGDFVKFGSRFYAISQLTEPRYMWGDPQSSFELSAKCTVVRKGQVITT